MRMRWMWLAWIAAVGLAHECRAQVMFQIESPGPGMQDLPLSPGASGTVSFSLLQTDTVSGTATIAGFLHSREAAFADYTFVADQPRCGSPALRRSEFGSLAVEFGVGPLAPQERITCRYQVTRAPASLDDLSFRLCISALPVPDLFCNRRLRIGTLPDQALRVTHLPTDADGSRLVRVHLVNHSAVAVESRVAATNCAEFGGGFIARTAFTIESGFAGACPVNDRGESCVNFTGVTSTSMGFVLGPVAAGGEATCLLRLRPRDQPGSTAVNLHFLDDRVQRSGGAIGFDPQSGNELVPLGLQPVAAPPVSVPLSPCVSLAIALMLALVATLQLRCAASPHD